MIISRVPLRISLAGGGTDVAAFYRNHGGLVVSTAIDKYIYVTLNEKFDKKTRVSYSITETVDDINDLKHDLARECLRFFSASGLEITSVADIPGSGTGLGSSSAFVVGLLACLSKKMLGKVYPPKLLSEVAYHIENKVCGNIGVGKQDACAAAYGGFNAFEFRQDDSIERLIMPLMPASKMFLEERFVLLYTGVTRSSGIILRDQETNLNNNRGSILAGIELKNLANNLMEDLCERKHYKVGKYLHDSWMQKKHLSSEISNPALEDIYTAAIGAGADGGKLLGAGGGGFFLFFAEPAFHEAIVKATGLRRVHFMMEPEGAKIIYDSK